MMIYRIIKDSFIFTFLTKKIIINIQEIETKETIELDNTII